MIRMFEEKDFDQVLNFSKEIYYPDFWEDRDTFRKKMQVFPDGCLAFVFEENIVGYSFAHPWMSHLVVDLDEDIVLPQTPDCYYIHDTAIDKNYRGRGFGQKIVEAQFAVARKNDLKLLKLISVLNSYPFWEKMGFEIVEIIKYTAKSDGIIMTRSL